MARFFANRDDICGDTIFIRGEDAHHIRKVLRMMPGDQLTVSDGLSMDYQVEILRFEHDAVITRMVASFMNRTEPPVDIALYQGIPKSDKMDYIIQKCTELGVSRVVPVLTDRTVVKLHTGRDRDTKVKRWRKIAEEAAKQSQRGRIPCIQEPCSFKDAVEQVAKKGLAIMPYENETKTGLKSVLNKGKYGSISVFIGPEGGFSDHEIKRAIDADITPVTLGPRILRTETAGIAVIAILMYELGDIG